MTTTRSHPEITKLAAITDPFDRAAACVQFIEHTRAALKLAEALRDESIRAAKDTRMLTIDRLAVRIKVRRNIVVEALRRRARDEGAGP